MDDVCCLLDVRMTIHDARILWINGRNFKL